MTRGDSNVSAEQNAIFGLGATQLVLGTLGASVFPTVIRPPVGCVGIQLKLLGAAGSTVQILPNAISGASIGGATAITTIGGYPLVTGEMYPLEGPACFYLAATGATATVAINFRFSAGGSTLS